MAKLDLVGFEDYSFIQFPFVGSVTETVEFLTDVIVTYDGSEDRTQNRQRFRQTFDVKVSVDLTDRQFQFNLLDQNVRGKWAVPNWPECQFVGNVVSGTTEISCDPVVSDFRQGGLVMIYQSNDKWAIDVIASVNRTSITLDNATTEDLYRAYAVPVNAGLILGEPQLTMMSRNNKFGIDYRLTSTVNHPTKIAVLFCVDASTSMGLDLGGRDRIEVAKSNVVAAIEMIRTVMTNSNVTVDLRIMFYEDTVVESTISTWIDASYADLDAAVDFVEAFDRDLIAGGSLTVPFLEALDFFGTDNVNTTDRNDILFILADTTNDVDDVLEDVPDAADLINRTDPFDGRRAVDIYFLGIGVDSPDNIEEAAPVENTDDEILNVTSDSTAEIRLAFERALSRRIGMQFEGYEVFLTEPTSTGETHNKSFIMQEEVVDFGGIFEHRTPWNFSKVAADHALFFEDLQEIKDFRKFLYRRGGRARAFYMPSFQPDIRVVSVAFDFMSAEIRRQNLKAYNLNRNTVAVLYKNGTWQPNRIESLVSNTMTFALPLLGPASEIVQISFMPLSRIASDSIELKWINFKAVETSMAVMEINK